MIAPEGFLDIGPQRLEYRMIGPPPEAAPTLVLLHEGLGSAALWGDFPDRLAAATGAGVFVYSRAGYGASTPRPLPWPVTYMHEEARETLPRVLAAIGFRRGMLVGHSDGASIAAIYAGSIQDHRVRGLVLMAPHFFTEEMGLAEIARARDAYAAGELRAKLSRWHADVDNAFHGWKGAWLDPEFRQWDIAEELAYIRVPILIVQGEQDQYGTTRQIEVAQQECYCPVDVVLLPDARHAPHRDAAPETLKAIAGFAIRILGEHEGALPVLSGSAV
jgi:pimeloyl-ACP methyl ester carboxylesterase